MGKSKKPTRHQQRLPRQRNQPAAAELPAALADLDAPVWDEIDADLREMMADRPFPWSTRQDLADAIVYIGETAHPADAQARAVAVGLMDALRTADESSPAVLRELRALFPPQALSNTNTFITACAAVMSKGPAAGTA